MMKRRQLKKRKRFFSLLVIGLIILLFIALDLGNIFSSEKVDIYKIENSIRLMGEESIINLIFNSTEFIN